MKSLTKHVIFVPIFERVLTVVKGDFEAIQSYIKTTHNVDLQTCLGAYTQAENQHFLLLTKEATMATLLHELIHATYGIIDSFGAESTDQELFCYINGFLLREVLAIINPEMLDKLDNNLC